MPLSHTLPNNIDKHSLANLFTSENILISMCLIARPNKSSLPINNFLESIKTSHNQNKPSWDNFEDQNFINVLKDYDLKTIINIASV